LPLASIAAGAFAMPLCLFDRHYADAITPLMIIRYYAMLFAMITPR
jgi:hypothetical protein